MKRPQRNEQGVYVIDGEKYKVLIGSRQQVWNGTAYKTPGGLLKNDLMMNKHHRIVSKAKHATAKKEKRLEKAGYFAEKGKFGFIKVDVSNIKPGSRKAKKSKKSTTAKATK